MGRLRRFLALPGADQRRLLVLIPKVALVRVSLWLLPYPVLARWASRPVRGTPSLPPSEWARLVRQASSAVPGASCLTQSLLLQRLLHRHGTPCSIQLGVRRDDGSGFAAHAWVTHEGQILLGGPDVSDYAVLRS